MVLHCCTIRGGRDLGVELSEALITKAERLELIERLLVFLPKGFWVGATTVCCWLRFIEFCQQQSCPHAVDVMS